MVLGIFGKGSVLFFIKSIVKLVEVFVLLQSSANVQQMSHMKLPAETL